MSGWYSRTLLSTIAVLAATSSGHAQAASHRTTDTSKHAAPLTRTQFEAQQECKSSINSRPGFQAAWVGKPVRREKQAWDVPVTVRRDGEVNQRATCRFDASSGRVTLRPR
jgi:hypothetical protein